MLATRGKLKGTPAAAAARVSAGKRPPAAYVVVAAGIVLLSVAFAFLFELGTLVGAPISTPLNPAHWNTGRIGIYFLLALPLSAFLLLNNWRFTAARLAAFLAAEDGARIMRWARRVLIGSVILVLVTLVVGAVCLACGNTQPGPYQLFGVCITVVIMAFYAARRKIAQRVERVALVIMLATGLLFSAMVPLYTHASWDDHIHYDRTVAASYLLDPEYTAADQALVHRQYNDVAWYSRYPASEGYTDPYDLQNQARIYAELNAVAEDDDAAIRVSGPVTLRGVPITEYYLVAYIPGAVALWFSRLLGLSAVTGFLLGRLANLLCYALVVFFALRRLKSGKLIMAACALIPEAVFLAAGYSYDFWLTAFVMLGFAYFIGELQRPDEPLTWRRVALMVGVFLVGLGPKAIYVPIAAMLLFMPRKKFAKAGEGYCGTHPTDASFRSSAALISHQSGAMERPAKGQLLPPAPSGKPAIKLTQAKYVALLLLSAAFVLATFLVPMFVDTGYSGDSRGGNVNPSYQIAFILSQPLAFLEIFGDFFEWYVAPEEAHHVLVDFCGVQTSFIDAIPLVLLPLVALLDRRGCDAAYATHPKRICMWLLVLLTIFLSATALFISFTPMDAGRINGMQGRYLIPLLYPLYAIGFNFKVFGRWGERWFGDASAKGEGAGEACSTEGAAGASLMRATNLTGPASAVSPSNPVCVMNPTVTKGLSAWLAIPQNRYALACYVVLGVCCLVLFLSIYDAIIQQYGRVSGMPMLDFPNWLSPDNWTWLESLPWRQD